MSESICQVQDINTHLLTCEARESHSLRCERLDPHGNNGHRIGQHTIDHDLSGNGYVCDGATIIGIRTFGDDVSGAPDAS